MIDLEVLFHRLILCSLGKHRLQIKEGYAIKECYWGCGYEVSLLSDKQSYH